MPILATDIKKTIPEKENRVIIPPILWFFGDFGKYTLLWGGFGRFWLCTDKTFIFSKAQNHPIMGNFPEMYPEWEVRVRWGEKMMRERWSDSYCVRIFRPLSPCKYPPYYPHIINAKKITFDERKVLPFLPFPLFSFFRPLYSFAPFFFPSVLLILFLLIFCPFPRSLFPHFKTFSKTFFARIYKSFSLYGFSFFPWQKRKNELLL